MVDEELADPEWELIAPCALLAISDRTHHALLLEPTAQFQPDRPYFGVLAQDIRWGGRGLDDVEVLERCSRFG